MYVYLHHYLKYINRFQIFVKITTVYFWAHSLKNVSLESCCKCISMFCLYLRFNKNYLYAVL